MKILVVTAMWPKSG